MWTALARRSARDVQRWVHVMRLACASTALAMRAQCCLTGRRAVLGAMQGRAALPHALCFRQQRQPPSAQPQRQQPPQQPRQRRCQQAVSGLPIKADAMMGRATWLVCATAGYALTGLCLRTGRVAMLATGLLGRATVGHALRCLRRRLPPPRPSLRRKAAVASRLGRHV